VQATTLAQEGILVHLISNFLSHFFLCLQFTISASVLTAACNICDRSLSLVMPSQRLVYEASVSNRRQTIQVP